MPITIGSKQEADFSDPIGLLSDCHRRIERFLGVLVTVATQAEGAALNPEQRGALEISLRYFKLAAPKHTLDEEDSLFPRLRDSQDPRAQPVLISLQKLSGDHRVAEEKHGRVEQFANQWLSDGALSGEDNRRLREMLAELIEFYAAHIALEEQQVFPLAAVVLTAADLQLIGSEMAKRRGVAARALGRVLA
jgi:hemerythrin-like domain-containing protein